MPQSAWRYTNWNLMSLWVLCEWDSKQWPECNWHQVNSCTAPKYRSGQSIAKSSWSVYAENLIMIRNVLLHIQTGRTPDLGRVVTDSCFVLPAEPRLYSLVGVSRGNMATLAFEIFLSSLCLWTHADKMWDKNICRWSNSPTAARWVWVSFQFAQFFIIMLLWPAFYLHQITAVLHCTITICIFHLAIL